MHLSSPSTSVSLSLASPSRRPSLSHASNVQRASLATMNSRTMGTMAQPPPLTSRCSRPSPNVCITVRHPSSYLSVCPQIHYAPFYRPLGKFVSESKFKQDPATFIPHIQQGDAEALTALITNPEVERRLLVRIRKKAMLYAQDFASDGEPLPNCSSKGKIDVDCVVDLYESYIIPLTKEIEVHGHLSCRSVSTSN